MTDPYKSWREAKKSAKLQMYSKAGDGFGMAKNVLLVESWIDRLYVWMQATGF
jgi:hypothetical protein